MLTNTKERKGKIGDMILKIAGIVNFKFKDYNAAVEDLSSCVRLDKDNKSAYTYLVSIKKNFHMTVISCFCFSTECYYLYREIKYVWFQL